MISHFRPAVSIFFAFTILTGVLYPAFVTVIAQVMFPREANGSLIFRNNQLIGSELIGQQFTNAKYFWGRASATSPYPYNAAASSGSNLGPTNIALTDSVTKRISALKQFNTPERLVPIDLVTSSASGLDPDISPAAAEYQVPRVAKQRDLNEDRLRALVREHTRTRQFGLLGEPRVNVLELNIALDSVMTSEQASNERLSP